MKKEKNKPDYLTIIRESSLIAGFILFGYGIWSVFPPAACIVCGALLMWVGIPQRRKGGD